MAHQTIGDVFAANRERYQMARGQRMMNGPGSGQIGTSPLGDRPGTTTVPQIHTWAGTPAGRARAFAVGFFVYFTFVSIAAEARYSD